MSSFFPTRRLSVSEIILIPEAYFYLFIFRIKLSFLPSREWMPQSATDIAEKLETKELKKALLLTGVINALEDRAPWKNTCLVKALAAHKMLQKRLIPHKVHLGLAPKHDGQLEAHAWLSIEEEVVVGGGDLERFCEIAGFV